MAEEPHPTKLQVIEIMRRIGLHDRIPEALQVLPDVIDVYRDGALLSRLGLGDRDAIRNKLGGSP
jgi:hypothetical protein